MLTPDANKASEALIDAVREARLHLNLHAVLHRAAWAAYDGPRAVLHWPSIEGRKFADTVIRAGEPPETGESTAVGDDVEWDSYDEEAAFHHPDCDGTCEQGLVQKSSAVFDDLDLVQFATLMVGIASVLTSCALLIYMALQ